VILVTSEQVEAGPWLHPVTVPRLRPAQSAIVEILVAQILVEAVAELRGVNVEEFVFTSTDAKVPVEQSSART
jgi:hypothetical protein